MTVSVDLILSHEDLTVIEDLLRDVNIQARAWGVTIERRPAGGLVERTLGPLISTLIHDVDCCVECEENARVSQCPSR